MNNAERQSHGGNEAAIVWRGQVNAARSGEPAAGFEAEKQRIAGWITREAAAAWAACGAFEWVALGYLAASSALIAVFAENLAHPVKLFGVQTLAAAVILILCRVEAQAAGRGAWDRQARRGTDRNACPTAASKFWHFWRHWYPHLFFLFCFEELGKLVHLVKPGWQDAKLVAGDAGAERFHAVRLSHVLHVSVGVGRGVVLPARLARLLVGDDVFGRGLRDRVLHCDLFSD